MTRAMRPVSHAALKAAALAVLVLLNAGAAMADARQQIIPAESATSTTRPSAGLILLAESSDRGTSLFEQRRKARYAEPEQQAKPAKPVTPRTKTKPTARTVKAPGSSRSVVAQPAVQTLGGYRTMCVRTCDGYYFPISPSSSKGQFKRDQQNCQAMCPGAEVQIYYQEASEETPETMMSLVGEKPYSELPAAFLYRNTSAARPEQCECNPGKSFAVMASGQPAGGFSSIEAASETTSETTTQGSFTNLGAIDPTASAGIDSAKAKEPATVLPPAADRKVRVVGPTFLPDPGGAIDLRARGLSSVQ
ncbi:DUF2865 domain-containing protein [Mesorhizobium sp. NBSH29]|uniref:DUF2865 domain-containing protein n=1 Tax=Mesorhizobium sp. NBSH29 TaxID=2654249 RepID=UPI0018968EDF|nr:DUF2865 domain-containing protein [Mesorhizobium sp. NBSH29]QPC87965.1 DUF2865 domain-containing protein [Mesorhizobium sp. NBSH29]